jgi:hypothetical protein
MAEDAETKGAVKAAYEQYNEAIGGDMRRTQECMQEIGKVLQKHECILVPRCVLSPHGAEFMIEAAPRPPGQSTGAGKKLTGYEDKPDAGKTGKVRKKGKSGPKKKGKKG